ncbi:MAG TPA: hypothetical protein VI636_08555, partial [Candidatus Angelobacter sp.]
EVLVTGGAKNGEGITENDSSRYLKLCRLKHCRKTPSMAGIMALKLPDGFRLRGPRLGIWRPRGLVHYERAC